MADPSGFAMEGSESKEDFKKPHNILRLREEDFKKPHKKIRVPMKGAGSGKTKAWLPELNGPPSTWLDEYFKIRVIRPASRVAKYQDSALSSNFERKLDGGTTEDDESDTKPEVEKREARMVRYSERRTRVVEDGQSE